MVTFFIFSGSNYSTMCIFGCPDQCHKSGSKLDKVVFMRFDSGIKNYKLRNPKDLKFVLNKDITFDVISMMKPKISKQVETSKTREISQQVETYISSYYPVGSVLCQLASLIAIVKNLKMPMFLLIQLTTQFMTQKTIARLVCISLLTQQKKFAGFFLVKQNHIFLAYAFSMTNVGVHFICHMSRTMLSTKLAFEERTMLRTNPTWPNW